MKKYPPVSDHCQWLTEKRRPIEYRLASTPVNIGQRFNEISVLCLLRRNSRFFVGKSFS